MDKNFNILIVGVGGQGIILASDIITKAALCSGRDAKKSEIHGMSQRGGAVFSHIRFGKKIYSPVIPEKEVDLLISLEEMETLRWLDFINDDGKIVLSESRIIPLESKEYPSGVVEEVKKRNKNVIVIKPDELLKKIGKPKFLNTAILGASSNFIDIDEN
ncbi:MAG TPA: indolepyruvate oxidoreductase subunit beta, partial [Spirochaetota bacterium]|nr:indolepyruvate oxidoreductase subunit beta [Spirochaetota bacterium]